MHNLAEKQISCPSYTDFGHVLAMHERQFIVRTRSEDVRANQAVSCLVQPRPGDMVLLAEDGAGRGFILSVLCRRNAHEKETTNLLFDGPVNLQVRDGDLSLSSDRDLSLACPETLACTSGNLSVHADSGRARITRLSFMGKLLRWQVKRVKSVAQSVDQICRRLVQRMESVYRYIEDDEETQAGSSRLLVEDMLSMHAKNAVVMAEEHVTVNAEQIHMG